MKKIYGTISFLKGRNLIHSSGIYTGESLRELLSRGIGGFYDHGEISDETILEIFYYIEEDINYNVDRFERAPLTIARYEVFKYLEETPIEITLPLLNKYFNGIEISISPEIKR